MEENSTLQESVDFFQKNMKYEGDYLHQEPVRTHLKTLITFAKNAEKEKPEVVTVDDISGVFNFGINGKRSDALAEMLCNMYPNGLRIVKEGE